MARHKSLHVLERKIREMQAQVAKLKQAEKPGMREVLALLKKHGLGLSDVKAALRAAKPAAGRNMQKGRKVKPKYRNPHDGSQTWTGRGRMPLWMTDLLKKGEKREDFVIKFPKSNGVRNGLGSGHAEATPCATPLVPRIASVDLPEMSGMVLEAPGVVSGLDEAPGRP
jgi:DNA-binding protein H-NS